MENDERIRLLADHLEIDPYSIKNSYGQNTFRISPRMTKSGDSPESYKRLGEDLKSKLEEIAVVGGPSHETWQAFMCYFLQDHTAFLEEITSQKLREKKTFLFIPIYHDLGHFVNSQFSGYMAAFDEFEAMHKYSNGLYHLLTGDPAEYHVQAIRSAFNGEEIQDTRESYETDSGEYMVLTDEEADQKAREYIEDSLWAFNASFLSGKTGLPEEVFSSLSEQCENGNDAILAIVEKSPGLDSFVKSAVSADGRGHFMNTYDGHETEIDLGDKAGSDEEGEIRYMYIYRTN